MRGLKYQLKSVSRDKFCLMTFLLPILVAVALNFMGSIDLSSLGELHFGVLENDHSPQTVTWLERYGPVTAYQTPEELTAAIKEPSTNVIGVKADGDSIKTAISGGELDIFQQAAATLPALYEQRAETELVKVLTLERPDILESFQDIFIPAVLIVAMFMGCTFNAMNIISEKEDGVAFINEILPMTPSQYIFQKVVVGFLFGSLSSIVTACICFRLSWQNFGLLLALIVMSSFVAALIGLFIGKLSEGLMTGVVYIKIVMLVFIAVPILCALIGASGPLAFICNIVPSQPAFDGIMALSAGKMGTAVKNVDILTVHCIVWFVLYVLISTNHKRQRQRLFIVLALIPKPQVVFLDELTTGLDARARRGIWKILKELKDGGLTIFLTSHFMDEVEALCDEICILQKGRAVFYGTVTQAKEKSSCENFEDAYLKLSGEGIE